MTETTTLYRPVGQKELDLIAESGFRAFPPRLFFQPIFYPVLNEEYATQIARDWNTKDAASDYVGYVTRFAVRNSFLDDYEIQTVGANMHQEYWIPAEKLGDFNASIVGPTEVIATFEGPNYKTAQREQLPPFSTMRPSITRTKRKGTRRGPRILRFGAPCSP